MGTGFRSADAKAKKPKHRARRFGVATGAFLALALATPSLAEGVCYDVTYETEIELMAVPPEVERAAFFRTSDERDGCPADSDECRRRAYLVPGDQVMVNHASDVPGFLCATFVNDAGVRTNGFLMADAVEAYPDRGAFADDWAGSWVAKPYATIDITPAESGAGFHLEGGAIWARDEEAMKDGNVHVGEFSADADPQGGPISFALVGEEQVAAEQAGEFNCAVWMRRVGPYLLVQDNMNCGGANVTFNGIYRRTK